VLHIGIARVHSAKEAKLRAWFDELAHRTPEVLETFQREGTRHEQVYIIASQEGSLLVYATEVDDKDKAQTAYENSTLKIDAEHRAVLTECLAEKLRLQPVFEFKA
jgi:hypothetical protein